MGYSTIVVYTRYTDVVLLLISIVPYLKEICEEIPTIYCCFEVGNGLRSYSVNEISSQITDATCEALPFLHAFTGCDTV